MQAGAGGRAATTSLCASATKPNVALPSPHAISEQKKLQMEQLQAMKKQKLEMIKQLRGFAKTVLKPGERQMVTFRLADRWLSNWGVATHSWKLATGEFKVGVGGSSDNLPLQGTLTVS